MDFKLKKVKKIVSLNPTRFENKYLHKVRNAYIEYVNSVFDCMGKRNRMLKVKSFKEWLTTEI